MNAQLTRRVNWHPASFVAASLVWMLGSGLNPLPLAAVDAPTVGWRTGSLKVSDNWNTLSFDVMVKRSRLSSTGASIGAPAPAASYHVERSSVTGSWKTVATVTGVDRFSVYSLNGLMGSPQPLPVARLEDDEDGTPVRAYDALGRLLPLAPLSTPITREAPLFPTRTTGRAWINNFVLTSTEKAARQLDLERRYGKAVKVNTLLRYRKTDGVITDEVMTDARVFPVTNSLTRGTKKVLSRSFTYGPAYAEASVRTKVRSETEVSASSTDRDVAETYFGNIELVRR